LAEAISKSLGEGVAEALDGGSVSVKVPEEFKKNPVQLLAQIEELEVMPVRKSRIVISERNGTIIAGGDVRLAPMAIVHGSLTIVVKETPQVSQPVIGQGTKVQSSEVTAKEKIPTVQFMEGAGSLADVADALGALGLSARELASVLSAMKTAGGLEAEVVVE
jgi:flagellar P-ring protein precursor FlgI